MTDVNNNPGGTGDPSTSKDEKTELAGGKTPDITKQLKELSEKVEHSTEVTGNLSSALKEVREKRKADKEAYEAKISELESKLRAGDDPGEFDPEDLKNLKKAGKAAKFVTEEDLKSREEKREIENSHKQNQKVLNSFITSHFKLFGSDDDATKEQNKNWTVFTKYIDEVFDLNKTTIPTARNLEKKLNEAIKFLLKGSENEDARQRGANETLVARKNAELLKVGSGSSGEDEDDKPLRHGTSKADAVQHLIASGYSKGEALELVYKKKS